MIDSEMAFVLIIPMDLLMYITHVKIVFDQLSEIFLLESLFLLRVTFLNNFILTYGIPQKWFDLGLYIVKVNLLEE
jgi:hypothetical protein